MLRTSQAPAKVRSTCRWLARALTPAAAALLVACGGGGGDSAAPANQVSGPPTTAATLANTANDAREATKTLVNAGLEMAAQGAAFSSLANVFVAPIAGVRSPNADSLAQIQAVRSRSCEGLLDLGCLGTVVEDTNVPDTATSAVPGDYYSLNFQGVSGFLGNNFVAFNGVIRLDFLSTVNLDAPDFAGLDLTLSASNFQGEVGGVPFGPVTQSARLQVSQQRVVSLTANGQRFSGLSSISFRGDGNVR